MPDPLTERGFIVLTVIFVVSRVIFWSLGVSFYSAPLSWYWQYLDVSILENGLASGLVFQHSQPPLFNAFLGLILKLSPEAHAVVFQGVYLACSMVTMVMMYLLLRLHGIGEWAAALLGAVFILSPEAILYENYLFYPWPLSTMVLVAAYGLHRYSETKSRRYAVLYAATIAGLGLTRPVFHLVYVLLAVAPLLVIRSTRRRFAIAAGGCAVLLVTLIFVKNLILFGVFGSSSWLGMNLWKYVSWSMEPVRIEELVREDVLPPIALVPAFSAVDQYPPALRKVPEEFRYVPALSLPVKGMGLKNLNHYAYIDISRRYFHGTLALLREEPSAYLRSATYAWWLYTSPPWSYSPVSEFNKAAIRGYVGVVTLDGPRRWIEGDLLGLDNDEEWPLSSHLVVPAGLVILIFGVGAHLLRARRDGRVPSSGLLFMTATVVYCALLVNLLEVGENQRFRVTTDAAFWTAGIIMLREIFIQARRWRSERRGSSSQGMSH